MLNPVSYSLVWPPVLVTLMMIGAAVVSGRFGSWLAVRADRRGGSVCVLGLWFCSW